MTDTTRRLPGFDAATHIVSADEWAGILDSLRWCGTQPNLPYALKRQRMNLVRAVGAILAETRPIAHATRQTPRLQCRPSPAPSRPLPSWWRYATEGRR